MVWVKKASAPDYFSLADAFLASITGDATWGWLVDWLTLVPNTGFNTDDFCAAGPTFSDALNITDFIPTFNPRDPRQALQTARLAYRVAGAAHDRVFSAYCEQPGPGGGGVYGSDRCFDVSASGGFPAVTPIWMVPSGTTKVRGKLLAHTGTFNMQLRYYSGMTSEAGPFTGLTALLYGDQSNRSDGDTNELTISGGGVYCSITLNGTATICVAFDVADDATPFVPTEQPQPTGVVSPLRTVDPSLEGIAAELERIELKSDWLYSLVQSVAGATLDLGGPLDTPIDVGTDDPTPTNGAVGVVVTCTGAPSTLDIGFGVPQQIAKLGRLNLGTDDAWYPTIPLTHTPFVLRPLPPGVTRLTVTGLPPMVTAQAAMMLPLK